MKTYLITGISGFAAGHYLEYLSKHRPEARIIGVDERPPELDFLGDPFNKAIEFFPQSLLDSQKIEDML